MAKLAPEFSLDFRKLLRTSELEEVIPLLPPGGAILEVGAGAGWQAKELASRGFAVTAIDITSSCYSEVQEWNVIEYDGYKIPLDDNSVDVVFSSNVMEHVPHIREFVGEMKRVLKPGGYMVHVMPTSLWRVATTIAFYPYRVKLALLRTLFARYKKKGGVDRGGEGISPGVKVGKLARLLFPTLHGVRGNFVTEMYYFSYGYWKTTFAEGGMSIASTQPAGLLYTGYKVLGALLPLSCRKLLAKVVGSSCRIYITEKK